MSPRAVKVVERVAGDGELGRKRVRRGLGFAYLDYSGSQVAGIVESRSTPLPARSGRTSSGAPSTAASRCSPTTSQPRRSRHSLWLGLALANASASRTARVEQSNFYVLPGAAHE